jgi:hypothetical protein
MKIFFEIQSLLNNSLFTNQIIFHFWKTKMIKSNNSFFNFLYLCIDLTKIKLFFYLIIRNRRDFLILSIKFHIKNTFYSRTFLLRCMLETGRSKKVSSTRKLKISSLLVELTFFTVGYQSHHSLHL